MMTTRLHLAAIALCTAVLWPAAHAAVILDDNFDANPLKLDTAPAGWSVSPAGGVSIVGSSSLPGADPAVLNDVLPGNGAYIDLIGSSGALATLVSPDLSLLAGTAYIASFRLAGNQSQTNENVRVSFGDAQQTFVLAPTDGFKTYTLSFTPNATAAYNLSFATIVPASGAGVNIGPGTGDRGALLDSVLVSSVPEPATYALLLAGLVGLHVVATRRLRAA